MTSSSTSVRNQRIARAFEQRYSVPPTLWARAPGRVDLMGSHTDYNLGYVVTMALDRDTWIAARPRADRNVELASLDVPGDGHFSLDNIVPDPSSRWADYVRGVAWALDEETYPLHSWDGLVQSTIPIGSGLSSSAALECAAATLFTALANRPVDPVHLAQLCQRAENEFVGVRCGILDQYTSMMGRAGYALLLDCRELVSEPVRIPGDIRIVICDTRFQRALASSEYGARRAACETAARILSGFYPDVHALRDVSPAMLAAHEADLPPTIAKRARFIVEESARSLELAQTLPRGDRRAIRQLTLASYAGARELYEVTVPEMDAMHAAMMRAPGAIGARQAGAGFGGCMVAFVEEAEVADFEESVRADYTYASGIVPEVYPVRPAAGAGLIQTP